MRRDMDAPQNGTLRTLRFCCFVVFLQSFAFVERARHPLPLQTHTFSLYFYVERTAF